MALVDGVVGPSDPTWACTVGTRGICGGTNCRRPSVGAQSCGSQTPHPPITTQQPSLLGYTQKYQPVYSLSLDGTPLQAQPPSTDPPAPSKSVLESATPAWTRSVHLDAPGHRHGQQPRLRDG
uniref:Uncharacterized protein n=1 Tax=Eutreptiella gymnastica TaxID=73025 RepID=A0A7S4LKU6_9EUGL